MLEYTNLNWVRGEKVFLNLKLKSEREDEGCLVEQSENFNSLSSLEFSAHFFSSSRLSRSEFLEGKSYWSYYLRHRCDRVESSLPILWSFLPRLWTSLSKVLTWVFFMVVTRCKDFRLFQSKPLGDSSRQPNGNENLELALGRPSFHRFLIRLSLSRSDETFIATTNFWKKGFRNHIDSLSRQSQFTTQNP